MGRTREHSRQCLVWVPVDRVRSSIDPGSGIVSAYSNQAEDERRVKVYYEGNRFGAAGLDRWVNRVDVAAGRALTSYPTVAVQSLPFRELHCIGSYDPERGQVTLNGPEGSGLLAEWLGVDEVTPEDLVTSHVVRQQLVRDLPGYLRSPDPGVQFEARRMARRFDIPV